MVMNKIQAKLNNIIPVDNLNLLEFVVNDIKINVLMLQINIDLEIGKNANLYIKPSKLFLSKEECNFENRLKVKIKNIKKGKILANIICEFMGFEIEVLMLKNFINFNNEAYLYFKSTDVCVEVVND